VSFAPATRPSTAEDRAFRTSVYVNATGTYDLSRNASCVPRAAPVSDSLPVGRAIVLLAQKPSLRYTAKSAISLDAILACLGGATRQQGVLTLQQFNTHAEHMKRILSAFLPLVVLVLAVGCKSGPPTLVPTLAVPSTKPAEPTETPIPTETLIPSATPIPTETPIPTARVRRQATLRAGPGVDYPVAGRANFGDTIIIYAKCEGWFQINPEGSQWIIEGKVTLEVDPTIIPDICSAP
jgi:hypothetical protein